MPLEEVLRLSPMAFQLHERYLDQRVNQPGPIEYYLMQLTAEVKKIRHMFAGDSTLITPNDCRMEFQVKSESESKEDDETNYCQTTDEIKMAFMIATGYVRSEEELRRDGVYDGDGS